MHRRLLDRLHDPVSAARRVASSATRWPDEIDLRIESILGQIDWLDQCYRRDDSLAWYRPMHRATNYRNHATLAEALGAMRADFDRARRLGFRMTAARVQEQHQREGQLLDLHQCRHWVMSAMEHLMAFRDTLIGDLHHAEWFRYPRFIESMANPPTFSPWYVQHVEAEYETRRRELETVTRHLDSCLLRAADLRRQLMSVHASPAGESMPSTDSEINFILRELSELDRLQAITTANPRVNWLVQRRSELLERLAVPQKASSVSPLSDEASQWLVRLSGGMLKRVDWNASEFTTNREMAPPMAMIDGRNENECPATDRAYAALAVRLAAADLLRRTNRSIPLVIEAHRELLRVHPLPTIDTMQTSVPGGPFPDINLAVIAALDDFVGLGNQVIVLGSDEVFSEQALRRGGRVFRIEGERVTHRHRPLWQHHFSEDTYAGPHLHTPTAHDSSNPLNRTDAYLHRYDDEYFQGPPVGESFAHINRSLDAIWQEAYGISPLGQVGSRGLHHSHDNPGHPTTASVTGDANWHDGYYFTDRY
ncbi:MAG: hypothetical protein AAGJ83_13655, partial [Planctomycetota bacterium]